ncbi:histidinol dehydrogenase [Sphingomicrobium sp. XHP0235]|uniref:histidinol dehydrogenase n=1 Tax=Sphingomicrobium aquimarinum TaxID=3133971 RepID=UPI0031FEE479
MDGVFDWKAADDDGRRAALARPAMREDERLRDAVAETVSSVRAGGWDALCEIALRIDGRRPERVAVSDAARDARATLPAEAVSAMELARDHIITFHEASRPADVKVETAPGLTVEKRWTPLGSAGLYVPGGKAPLFSTLMMLAIPARVAGVERLTVVTPPRLDGELDPAIALAADLCGIEAIWTVGGAQAIAALAFGAGDIEPVARICGPGNAWVAAAKSLVSSLPGGPGIDLPAGPSELMVIADDAADPARVAADLLSQAEHDLDAQALLVSPSSDVIEAVLVEVASQKKAMGGDFADVRAIRCSDLEEAAAIANRYAPEHLSLAVEGAASLTSRITDAGAVFVGGAMAETFGDYLAGSSHVLPTDGAARYTGGVTVHSFMKAVSFQTISDDAAERLAPAAAALARLEGLEAHARAADARLTRAKEAAE